jgi:hypothetical protein
LGVAAAVRLRAVVVGFREAVARDAADRAAVLRFRVFVCAAARLAAARRGREAVFRRRAVVDFAAVFDRFFAAGATRFFVDVRLATLPPIRMATDHPDRCGLRSTAYGGTSWRRRVYRLAPDISAGVFLPR